MLETLDAPQIARWKAYEITNGKLDRTWDSEVLAQIHELLQMQLKVSTQSKNDIQRIKRPWRVVEVSEEEIAAKEAREKTAAVSGLDAALGFKEG